MHLGSRAIRNAETTPARGVRGPAPPLGLQGRARQGGRASRQAGGGLLLARVPSQWLPVAPSGGLRKVLEWDGHEKGLNAARGTGGG